jgi:hypothetical protein
MADRIQVTTAKAGNQVQESVGNVAEKAGDMADYAQLQAQRAQGWLECTWNDNPWLLAGGALALLALGTLVGLEAVAQRELRNRQALLDGVCQ